MIIIIVYEDLGKTMECPKIYCTHFNRYAKFQSSCCSYQQWLILPKINCFRWWNSGFSRIWKLCGQVQTGTHHNPRKCGKCNQNSKQCSLDFSIAKGSTGNLCRLKIELLVVLIHLLTKIRGVRPYWLFVNFWPWIKSVCCHWSSATFICIQNWNLSCNDFFNNVFCHHNSYNVSTEDNITK